MIGRPSSDLLAGLCSEVLEFSFPATHLSNASSWKHSNFAQPRWVCQALSFHWWISTLFEDHSTSYHKPPVPQPSFFYYTHIPRPQGSRNTVHHRIYDQVRLETGPQLFPRQSTYPRRISSLRGTLEHSKPSGLGTNISLTSGSVSLPLHGPITWPERLCNIISNSCSRLTNSIPRQITIRNTLSSTLG